MPNLTLQQIYVLNPTTTIGASDLLYISQSPYAPGDDAAITGGSIAQIIQKQSFLYGTDSGVADTYVLTLTYPIASYTDGLQICFKASNSNSGASTIDVSGIGAADIKSNANTALTGGEIVAGRQYYLIYSSTLTCFVLLNTSLYTISGDVGGSGPWNNIPVTIGNNVVTYAKMQQASASTILGNPTGAPANISEITLGAGLAFAGTTLTATATTSPLTTKGDIWVYSSANTRLPVGVTNGQILQVSSGAATGLAWSSASYPTSTTANQILYSSGTNTVAGLTSGASGVLVTDGLSVPSILAGAATNNLALFSSNSTNPGWSAYSFPSSVTASGILFANTSSSISTITPVNNAVLVTNGSGVPALSTTLPSGLTIPGFAASGANSDITSMSGLTGYLQAPLGIKDSNGNVVIGFSGVSSAVNYINITNSADSGPTVLSQATGTSTTIFYGISSKGNGAVYINDTTGPGILRFYETGSTNFVALSSPSSLASDITFTLPSSDGSNNFVMKTNGSGNLSLTNGSQIAGTATNDDASSGNISEYISNQVLFASAVSMGSGGGAPANITNISLTAGDWDVGGNIILNTTGTTPTAIYAWVSSTSSSLPEISFVNGINLATGTLATTTGISAPNRRFSLSGTTTIYLTGQVNVVSGTPTCAGFLWARRAR